MIEKVKLVFSDGFVDCPECCSSAGFKVGRIIIQCRLCGKVLTLGEVKAGEFNE